MITPKIFVERYFGANVFPARALEGLEVKQGCFLAKDEPKEKIRALRTAGWTVRSRTVASLNDSVHYLAARKKTEDPI